MKTKVMEAAPSKGVLRVRHHMRCSGRCDSQTRGESGERMESTVFLVACLLKGEGRATVRLRYILKVEPVRLANGSSA